MTLTPPFAVTREQIVRLVHGSHRSVNAQSKQTPLLPFAYMRRVPLHANIEEALLERMRKTTCCANFRLAKGAYRQTVFVYKGNS